MRMSAACIALFTLALSTGLGLGTPAGTLLLVAHAAEPLSLNGEVKADSNGTETGTVTLTQNRGKKNSFWKLAVTVSGAAPGAKYRILVSTRTANDTPVARVVKQVVATKAGKLSVNATIKVPNTSQITGGSLMRPDLSSNGYRAVAFFELK